ncbi:MAG: ABC transporter ATP-binding protein [Lewinellaceae bacterium]|nr:ABC transporter ATP-binding protein [Lewinellaceae bacterium]MCB9295714.1 ABC transporter ATP-binding protein [Lewinellaceae bacterium]
MIEAYNLSKSFNGQPALKQLNLAVAPGEIYALLGANGAGKTTTIHLFLNFLKPDEGEARIDGQNVAANPQRARAQIAYIPENIQLYPNLSGMENLAYFSALTGKKYERAELEMFLTEAGLEPEAFDKRARYYSKGMRQKTGIAIALAKQAKALLLDEPTSGLDPQASNEFASLLKRLSEYGIATLMATHDLFRAKETATHIGIMRSGELVQSLRPKEIGQAGLEALYLQQMSQP